MKRPAEAAITMTEAAYDLQVAENDWFADPSNAEARREHAGRARREAPRASRPTARMIAGTRAVSGNLDPQ